MSELREYRKTFSSCKECPDWDKCQISIPQVEFPLLETQIASTCPLPLVQLLQPEADGEREPQMKDIEKVRDILTAWKDTGKSYLSATEFPSVAYEIIQSLRPAVSVERVEIAQKELEFAYNAGMTGERYSSANAAKKIAREIAGEEK